MTMIEAPICYHRKCTNYLGVKNDGDEMTEKVICKVYPDRIPSGIAYGDDVCEDYKPEYKPEEEDKP